MNNENFDLAERYVPHGYVQQGREARRSLEKNIRQLFEQGKLPKEGWSDLAIKHLLSEIALMDSNNFPNNCGVGEREARIASQIVAERHFYLGHGMGRSGDIGEVQPKAAGSSLLAKLANQFALDVIKLAGVTSVKACQVYPVATGMALVLSMITLKEQRPKAKYVIWPRIDQKSCFKSILTAGLEPIIIENILHGDHLSTDVRSIKNAITRIGKEKIACVLSTTSCFAPRIPDRLEDIGAVCKEMEVPHVVNNAYGVQASKCMHLIQQASRIGRVDVFVQSTDKNFMVPVGGSIIAGFDAKLIQAIGKMYPGRASASPIIDFFITMLSLGSDGYKRLLQERKELFIYLQDGLNTVAEKFNEKVLVVKQNQISLGLSLQTLDERCDGNKKMVTEFGSYLFKRSVSGTRVVTTSDEKTIGRYIFKGWGAHYSNYPCSYMTAAAAIGTTRYDIDLFLKRLEKNFKELLKPVTPVAEVKNGFPNGTYNDESQEEFFDNDKTAADKIDKTFCYGPRNLPWKLHTPDGMQTSRSLNALNDRTIEGGVGYSSGEKPRFCFSEGEQSPDGSRTWPKVNKTQSKQSVVDSEDDVQSKRALRFTEVSAASENSGASNQIPKKESTSSSEKERRQNVVVTKDLSLDKLSFLIDL